MNRSLHFAAPWGRPLKIVSVGAVLIFTVVAWLFFDQASEVRVRIGVILAWVAVHLAGMAFVVLGYELDGEGLSILRPGWRTRIAWTGLEAVEADPELLRETLRIMGNGGFFSFTGWYWNRRLGRFRLFSNDGRRAVLLRFRDRRVVVSPCDPPGFVTAVRAVTGLSGNAPTGDGRSVVVQAHGRT